MTIFYCFRFETHANWRARAPYLYFSEQSGLIITPGTGFHFRRPLRLAGLRWRYSNPLPHGVGLVYLMVASLYSLDTERIENITSNYILYCCASLLLRMCVSRLLTKQWLSSSVFMSQYTFVLIISLPLNSCTSKMCLRLHCQSGIYSMTENIFSNPE
jgi:hypothetical protein